MLLAVRNFTAQGYFLTNCRDKVDKATYIVWSLYLPSFRFLFVSYLIKQKTEIEMLHIIFRFA